MQPGPPGLATALDLDVARTQGTGPKDRRRAHPVECRDTEKTSPNPSMKAKTDEPP